MSQQSQRIHAIVFGRVQGVSFRYYTVLRAGELGLTGWVRNLADGTVETTAEGTKDQLDAFVDFLNTGPEGAHVTQLDIKWLEASGEFSDFNVR